MRPIEGTPLTQLPHPGEEEKEFVSATRPRAVTGQISTSVSPFTTLIGVVEVHGRVAVRRRQDDLFAEPGRLLALGAITASCSSPMKRVAWHPRRRPSRTIGGPSSVASAFKPASTVTMPGVLALTTRASI